jgi:uncharacterized repeat protein (TIGR03806 family)
MRAPLGRTGFVVVSVMLAGVWGCAFEPQIDSIQNGVEKDPGLDEAPVNVTCVAPDRPPSESAVTLENAFPNIKFNQPLLMLERPDSSAHWYVMEKRGVIWRIPAKPTVMASDANQVLDHTAAVNDNFSETGLLGFAFHPKFAQNGFVYLSYSGTINGKLTSIVSRMKSTDGGKTFDKASELILMTVPDFAENHNGGMIAFGPDGFLYISFGDGGGANDPQDNGQKKNTRFGKILRIDVDNVPAGQKFGIPADNPFADGQEGLPEIYAYGLRNVWRFSFDTKTGKLWAGDVGQNAFEEIDIIENGGNYGWDKKEAFDCVSNTGCNNPEFIDPIFAYAQQPGNNRSITGGYVYHGGAIPALEDSYIYGDFVSGRIWALSRDPDTDGWSDQLLLEAGMNISSFAQDKNGEVYVLSFGDGTIHKLVPEKTNVVDKFPKKLSDTGCFDENDVKKPAEGLIPFTVNMPLWSDGAEKERFVALPPGGKITIQPDGDFEFPIGTVMVKTFFLGKKRVETRLFIRHDDGGWAGYTYEWNASQTDASLLKTGKSVTVSGQNWTIPSRADCSTCHTAVAGRTLGPEIAQINGDFFYEATGKTANQLVTWKHIGLFANPPNGNIDSLPKMPTLDETANKFDKARAYLHANCANCHQPGGPGRSDADFRFSQNTVAKVKVCNVVPEGSNMGVTGAALVVPGKPAKSIVSLRMKALNQNRMPPIATSVVDDTGTDIIDAWITSLTGCP